MADDTPCPCGTNKPFADCCKPYLEKGKIPATAEALMRSRYSAYALGKASYLLKTWHPETAPEAINMDTSPTWYGLEVVGTWRGQENDRDGVVEFKAHYLSQGKADTLHEVSRFVRLDGRWFYVSGEILEPDQEKNKKVGRNDPCPCGSGKKFKKCCLD